MKGKSELGTAPPSGFLQSCVFWPNLEEQLHLSLSKSQLKQAGNLTIQISTYQEHTHMQGHHTHTHTLRSIQPDRPFDLEF